MTDSLLLPISLDRITDTNNKVLAGGKVRVDNAGTSTLKAMFLDAGLTTPADNPYIADGAGYVPPLYIGIGSYKLTTLSSDDVTQKTEDNLPGALDTSGFDENEATPVTPVETITAEKTIALTDKGKVFLADCTGGSFNVTLLSAVTATDGFRVTIKHIGTANSVTVSTSGGQTLDGAADFALTSQWQGITCVSDGAKWSISESARLAPTSIALPRGHIGGLKTSRVADRSIQIDPGEARDATGNANLSITASGFTKDLGTTWAAGSGNGGRAAGVALANDTWYHVFLADLDAGGTDAGFDTSVKAVNLLATTDVGTHYRRIGSVLTDGSSNVIAYTQEFDEFLWDSPVNIYDQADPGTAPVTHIMKTPLGVKTWALCSVNVEDASPDTATGYGLVLSPDQTGTLPISTIHHFSYPGSAGTFHTSVVAQRGIRTNKSSQIVTRLSKSDAAITQKISGFGWVDPLGRGE